MPCAISLVSSWCEHSKTILAATVLHLSGDPRGYRGANSLGAAARRRDLGQIMRKYEKVADDQTNQSWAIVRALNVHKANGLIWGWRALPWSLLPFHLLADQVGGKSTERKSRQQTTVFIHPQAAAGHALVGSLESEKV